MLGLVAEAGREPHGGGVVVRLAAAALGVLRRPCGRGGERRDRVAERAAERGRLFGRALAGVRGRDEDPGLVRRELARRRAQALRQRPLAVPAAKVAEQLLHGARVDAVAEGLRGFVVQQVRLVDDHVVERRQRLAAGEQQGVVHADEVRRLRAGPRQPPVAAAARGAVAAQAGRAGRAQLAGEVGERGEDLRRPVGQRGEVDVAAPRAADEVGEGEGAVRVGQGLALGGHGLVQAPPAQVVLAAHEQRPAPPRRQSGGDERQLGAGQLPLQRLGLGAHEDAAAVGGPGVGRRQQVAEALAHAGPRLEDADAAALEDVGGGVGVRHLTGAPAEPGEAAGESGGRLVAVAAELGAPGVGPHGEDRRAARGPRAARRRPAAEGPLRAPRRTRPGPGAAPRTRSRAGAAPPRPGRRRAGRAGRAPPPWPRRRGAPGARATRARAPPPGPAARAGPARGTAGAPPPACRTSRPTAAACRCAAPPPPGARGRRRRCAPRGWRRRRTHAGRRGRPRSPARRRRRRPRCP